MELIEAIRKRRSVRSYLEKKIDGETRSDLENLITTINLESGLSFQLLLDEPKAFDNLLSRYGWFSGVRNYIALVGKKSDHLEENVGYFGEKTVLEAERMGLNTCWVGGFFNKNHDAVKVEPDEKYLLCIAIGYGVESAIKPRKSKLPSDVISVSGEAPGWFINGVSAALLAPTAMNQQNFTFIREGDRVCAKAGLGFFTKVDLGIVKYHFEVGSGKDRTIWVS